MWLADRNAIWWNQIVDKRRPAEIVGAIVAVEDLYSGFYNVEWWHTSDGKAVKKDLMLLANGPLRISVPSFTGDIACKITPLRKATTN